MRNPRGRAGSRRTPHPLDPPFVQSAQSADEVLGVIGAVCGSVVRREPRVRGSAHSADMTAVRLHRWDEIALDKLTELVARKIIAGEREMLVQSYLKKGALVPRHAHESEQMTYVLQGALKFVISGEEFIVREGEVLHIPSGLEHQAEALDDTFELDVFSPLRSEWLGGGNGSSGA